MEMCIESHYGKSCFTPLVEFNACNTSTNFKTSLFNIESKQYVLNVQKFLSFIKVN